MLARRRQICLRGGELDDSEIDNVDRSRVVCDSFDGYKREAVIRTHGDAVCYAAALDWIIVRDGPGTWAKNVDWDEYLIRVHTKSLALALQEAISNMLVDFELIQPP